MATHWILEAQRAHENKPDTLQVRKRKNELVRTEGKDRRKK